MSATLINQTAILDNTWSLADGNDIPNTGNVIVELNVFLEQSQTLLKRGNVAVVIKGDEQPELLAAYLDKLPLICVNFPAFTDGRGYSIARLLRERFNYQGDIRAIGDVLLDQLFFMRRCGISSYLLKEGLDGTKALGYLKTIGESYQTAVDIPQPLFRRR
jgi:uncharacterized protein (DUF934 family)